MTQSDTSLLQGLVPLLANGRYLQALDSLRNELTRLRVESRPEVWRAFCVDTFAGKQFSQHPLARLLKESQLGSGCTGAAGGLIHEPLVLDVILGVAKVASDLTASAGLLRGWELELGFCESLRSRYRLFVRELKDLGATLVRPRILAVGCGHLREAAELLSLENLHSGELVAFDRDRACVDLIEREYRHPGLRAVSGSLRDLTNDASLGQFDLIYLPTMLDKLEESRASALLNSLLPMLKPGGRLLAANFSPDLTDSAYLEAALDWWPLYRAEEQIAALLSRLSSQNLRGQAIFRDESGGSVFIDLQTI